MAFTRSITPIRESNGAIFRRGWPAARIQSLVALLRVAWTACGWKGWKGWCSRSPRLQRFVLARHQRAIEAVLSGARADRIAIVGGEHHIQERALILRRLLPEARITVVDQSVDHLEIARAYLAKQRSAVPSAIFRFS